MSVRRRMKMRAQLKIRRWILSWTPIFILRLRFPPGKSLVKILMSVGYHFSAYMVQFERFFSLEIMYIVNWIENLEINRYPIKPDSESSRTE